MRILFADDTSDTLKLYRLILELQGYTVETVSDGKEAVRVVQHSLPYDVILLDMEMPRMNGLDALKAIRAMPQGQHAAIILFTAYEAKALHADVEDIGADFLLPKPALPQQLIAAIHEAVQRRQSATPQSATPPDA